MAEKTGSDRGKSWIGWGIACVVALYLFGFFDVNASRKPSRDPNQHASWVSAEDLNQEYKTNELRANGRYKDKPVIVTGEVQRVEVSMDRPLLKLKAGRYDHVACFFDQASGNHLARLSPGDRVEVKGWGSGLTLGTVYLADCAFYKR